MDLEREGASAEVLERALEGEKARFDLVVYSAGYFTIDVRLFPFSSLFPACTLPPLTVGASEQTLSTLSWTEMSRMLAICALAPAFILSRLNEVHALEEGGKVILVTTEGGSVTLRTSAEGGGNYGHHASKVSCLF